MNRTECTNVNNFILKNRNIRMRIKGGARFWFGAGGTGKISYISSTQVRYCNGVAKISD